MKIFKTKQLIPIIFDEEDYKDKVFIETISLSLSNRHGTFAEINSDGYSSISNRDAFTRYITRDNTLDFIPGVLILSDYYKTNKIPYTAIVCKDKKGKLKGVFYRNDLSGVKLAIFNKFFKRYGITRKDIIVLTKNEISKNFLWPISADIKDYNEDYQKELSNKFLNKQ